LTVTGEISSNFTTSPRLSQEAPASSGMSWRGTAVSTVFARSRTLANKWALLRPSKRWKSSKIYATPTSSKYLNILINTAFSIWSWKKFQEKAFATCFAKNIATTYKQSLKLSGKSSSPLNIVTKKGMLTRPSTLSISWSSPSKKAKLFSSN